MVGRVTATGRPAPLPPQAVDRQQQLCGASVVDESLQVAADGGIANVVVQLEGREESLPPGGGPNAPTLDAHGCRFEPHVLALRVGQVLRLRNLDPIRHSVHASFADGTTAFDIDLPIQGQEIPVKMKGPGLLRVRSEAGYGWMSAVVAVARHRHVTVSGPDGSYRLSDLPEGSYQLRFWHETLGEKVTDVQITAGGELRADLSFSLP